MRPVVVNDASRLIDLCKDDLLSVLGNLPYRLVVPLPVREFEILDFTDAHWHALDPAGLVTYDLSPDEIGQALALKARYPALSPNDCFCFVAAHVHTGVLLTGDRQLRNVADANGLPVHGVLWVIDQLQAAQACSACLLTRALRSWQSDVTVFLPRHEIANRLDRLLSLDRKCGPPRRANGEIQERE